MASCVTWLASDAAAADTVNRDLMGPSPIWRNLRSEETSAVADTSLCRYVEH